MGAWGWGPFENDDASDWVYELEEAEGPAVLLDAFEAVADDKDDYVDADVAARAIAAAEVVAALLGRPGDDLPEEAEAWVDDHLDDDVEPELVSEAVRAVRRVKSNSELQELWEDSDDADDWKKSLDDLVKRLTKR